MQEVFYFRVWNRGKTVKKLISAFFDKRFLKFCIVGVVNTLVGTAVMYGLYNLAHCGYWFSSAMNYVVGSVVSYFLNKYFTFNVKKQSWQEIVRFVINILFCYLIAYGVAKPLARLIFSALSETARDNIAMLAGMVFFVPLNYLGQRFFAFRGTGKEGSDGGESEEN